MIALRGDPAIYASWGWDDVDEAWARVMIPTTLPLDVELGPLDRALLAAAPDAAGVPLTRRDGRRVSAADAYLTPVLGRDNLVVRTDAAVARIVFDGRRACGMELVSGEVIEADHVVVSAGAIHTPALLLRSGVDTPGVGDGLQDHPSVAFTLRLEQPVSQSGDVLATGSVLQRDGLQVLPLNHLGSSDDVAGYGALMAAVMRPLGAAGTVRLASDDPTVEPVVEFNLLSDPEDLDQMVSGTNLLLDLIRREPFRAVASEVFVDEHGTPWTALSDLDRLVAWVRSAAGGYVHATGTCAMGTVVDDDATLVGYDGVHVCDASVFPSIPDANTHLPTTMLAERLVARWRYRATPSPARMTGWLRRFRIRSASTRSETAGTRTCNRTAGGGGATPDWSSVTACRCSSTRCSISGSPRRCSTPMSPLTTAAPIDTVVNTHANGDHCYGNAARRAGAEIIASTAPPHEMAEVPRRCSPA